MTCNTMTCSKPATRVVLLTSRFVQMSRPFCDECAAKLCARTEDLIGTDLGPVVSN